MIRAFVAFDVNNEQILKRFSEIQSRLMETGANLKIVKPRNIHITLRFLGNVSPSTIDQIYEEMKNVSFHPFNVEIKGVGAFPNLNYIRVIWAGIKKGENQLMDIFNQLEPRLQRLGFKTDRRGFSPHLTIARVRTAQNKTKLAQYIKECEVYNFGEMEADCLRLKESVLTTEGPVYSTLHVVKGI